MQEKIKNNNGGQDLYIGIDGGGTKTKIRIEDAAGNLVGEAKSGPAQIHLSVSQAWQSVMGGIVAALSQAKLKLDTTKLHLHVGLGLAGCEDHEAAEKFLSRPHPFKTLILSKDSYTAALGAHSGKDGAIIIIGTGVAAMQLEKGDIIQVGGFGFPFDDKGGGAWLGLKAVGLVLEWYDGRIITNTPLLKNILAKFDNDFSKFLWWVNRARATQYAELAPLVLDALEAQDKLAESLVKRAARAINKIGAALAHRTKGDKPLSVTLFGGIAPFIKPYLAEDLQVRLKERDHDANWGAIYMVRNNLNPKWEY